MPKVVSGKGFDEFVQEGKFQTIDAGSKKPAPVETPKSEEAKAEIAKAEEATAKEIEPNDDGLEPDDADLAERAKNRINKKHREMKQAQALADKLKAELEDTENFSKTQYQRAQAAEEQAAALKKELEGLRTQAPKAESGELKAPDESDKKFFNDKGEFQLKLYEAARDEYVIAKFERAQAEKAQAKAAEDAQKVAEGRVAKFIEKTPDYRKVMADADVKTHNAVLGYLTTSEYIGEISYYLAKNPDFVERINKLTPVAAVAEIGELVGEWKREKRAEPSKEEKPSNVVPIKAPPAPITPLSGSGSPGVNTDPAKMTPKELLAYTRERELARKKR